MNNILFVSLYFVIALGVLSIFYYIIKHIKCNDNVKKYSSSAFNISILLGLPLIYITNFADLFSKIAGLFFISFCILWLIGAIIAGMIRLSDI